MSAPASRGYDPFVASRITPSTRRTLERAWWAACGGIVVLFILLAALGAVDPAEAEVLTAAVLVLAVAWLGHSWRRLWLEERGA